MRAVLIAAALGASSALAQAPAATTAPPPTPAPAPASPTEPTLPPIGGSPPVPAKEMAPAPAATATASTATAAPPAESAPAPAPEEPAPNWGVMVDAGIPDGIGASAVFRPMTWLRLAAGGTHNFSSAGLRASASVVPFYFAFSPSVNVEVGHVFGGDVRPLVELAYCRGGTCPGGVEFPVDERLLREVGYQYGTASLGLEFGSPGGFIIFLRGGLSLLQGTLVGFQQVLQDATGDTTLEARDLNMKLVAPSLKLGLIIYF